jgi:predicted small metal-binding protein
MALMFVACSDYIDEGECTVPIGAETLEETIEAAVEHAYGTHGEEDTPALRELIRDNIRERIYS